jgi:hypothetical protein
VAVAVGSGVCVGGTGEGEGISAGGTDVAATPQLAEAIRIASVKKTSLMDLFITLSPFDLTVQQ